MINEGTYKAKIIGCFTGESKEKKTPYYGLEFELEDNQTIDFVAYLTENTYERQIQTLIDVGYVGKKMASLSNPELTIEDMFNDVGPISLVIEHEEYTTDKGEIKKKAVIKWVNMSGGPAKFDYEQSVKTFKGLSFDGHLMRMNKGAKKVEPKALVPEVIEDDDIPF